MASSTTPDKPRSSGLLDLEKELVCSICTEVLYQPLTLLDCLHTFCGSCLKEWFSWQAQRYRSSPSTVPSGNPYTCPSCRASVRETRPNATVTTLLEMFLKANPSRDRSAAEKEEIAKQYKVGDVVTPRLDAPRTRSRDHRRTDRQTEAEEEERRLLAAVVERSRRETTGGGRPEARQHHTHLEPGNSQSEERSHSRENRERREREERHRRRREEERRRRRVVEAADGQPNRAVADSVPTTQAVQEAEQRQRQRQIEHQASLRSLMSASDGETAMEEEILRQIIDEGILEGLGIEDINGAQGDEISNRIAEAYRQRHPSRRLPRNLSNPSTSEARTRHPHSHSPTQSPPSTVNDRTHSETSLTHPSVTRAHFLEAPELGSTGQGHQRRASDQARRQTSPNPQTVRRTSDDAVHQQAVRSATDLASRTQTADASRPRPRHMSDVRRVAEAEQPRISEMWRNAAVRGEAGPRMTSQQAPTDSPQHLSPTGEQPPAVIQYARLGGSESSRGGIGHPRSDAQPAVESQPPQPVEPTTLHVEPSFLEPDITCDRCSKPSIQYSLYKHCSRCSMNLCVQCYREKRGCKHWFGFGHSARLHFNTSLTARTPESLQQESPHVLIGRKYLRPPVDARTRTEARPSPQAPQLWTTSNPAERLQEGRFCDRCFEFSNTCHWECGVCNEGEWGFCNECVNTQHCCTHALLPVAHKDFVSGTHHDDAPDYSRRLSIPAHASVLANSEHISGSRPSSSDNRDSLERSLSWPQNDIEPGYLPLTFTTHCDVCAYPIPPSSTRFHCPFHVPSSPNSEKGKGDFDICTNCYAKLGKTGAISAANGINGWRRCPRGHRMVVTGFEERGDGQRRVVAKDLVGGWALKDEYYETSTQPVGSKNGVWSWKDAPERGPTNRSSRTKSTSLTSSPNLSSLANNNNGPIIGSGQGPPPTFPPSGGIGLHCQALWSYLPDSEVDPSSKDELLFPRGAEIREAEDINGDWFWGVYMGDKGVFPATYIRVVGAVGL